MFLDSTESDTALKGEVYALMAQPLSQLATSLASPRNWCELLLLHPNVALCRTSPDGISLALGNKLDPSLHASTLLAFSFHVAHNSSRSLQVQLDAKTGPLGTRDYRILLVAVPVAEGKSFLHLSYSYRYGTAARLTARAYLATKGRGKVGFTVVGSEADGQPKYVGGLRGIVERNAMRYYLAINAYLGSRGGSSLQGFERSLNLWFDDVERFALQLKEGTRVDYLRIKRDEYQRQQAARAATTHQ